LGRSGRSAGSVHEFRRPDPDPGAHGFDALPGKPLADIGGVPMIVRVMRGRRKPRSGRSRSRPITPKSPPP
jgi:hypothetical protein